MSCESDLFIKQNELEKTIVVNSLITPDSLLSCHLSLLGEPLQNGEDMIFVEEAQVAVLNVENKDTLAKLHYRGNGWYYSTTEKPVEGIEYQLVVAVEGFDKISATTTIPAKGKVKNIVYELFAARDEFYEPPLDDVPTLKFTIIDSVGYDNYYDVDMIPYRPDIDVYDSNGNQVGISYTHYDIIKPDYVIIVRPDSCRTYDLAVRFYCKDPVFLNEKQSFKNITAPSLLFSDQTFNGLNVEIESNFEWPYVFGYGLLLLKTVSKEYYDYRTSIIHQQWEECEKDFDPFGGGFNIANEHIDVKGNIKNGYGIFAGYNLRVYDVRAINRNNWWDKYIH